MCSGFFGKVPVSFHEVAVYFSEDEWQSLEDGQRNLYKDVMQDNLEAVLSLEDHFHQSTKEEREIGEIALKPKRTGTAKQRSGLHKDESQSVLEKVPHVCSECQEHLGSWSLLITHKRLHLRTRYEKPFNMEMVDNTATTPQQTTNSQETVCPRDDLTRCRSLRQRICRKQRLYKCIECEKSFMERAQLNIHKKTHMEDKIIKIEKVDSGYSELVKPKTEVEDGLLHCIHCSRTFSHWSLLVEHEKIHASKFFSCSDCGKCFHRKSILVLHRRTHTGERPFACTDCEKRFSQRFNLVIHQRIHTGERPYKCATCDKSFRYKPSLVKHEKQAKCVKNTTRKGPLIKTKSIQPLPQVNVSSRNVPNPSIVQPQASAPPSIYHRSVPLSSSQLYIVPPSTPHPIVSPPLLANKVITKAVPQPKNTTGKNPVNHQPLVSYNQSMHPHEKPFKCGQCKKAFIQWNHLMEHQKSHTGSRNVCTECNKCFIRRSTLILHRRTHTGEKPYVCMECGKRFSQRFNLVVHQRIHTGERPYKCKDCEKAFRYRAGLLRHQKYVPCIRKQKAGVHPPESPKTSIPSSPKKHTPIKPPSISPGFTSSSSSPLFMGLSRKEQTRPIVQPVECLQCKQTFLEWDQLVRHQQTHRQAQNPGVEYRQTFARRSRRNLHQRVHTEDKPIPHEEYGKRFSQQINHTVKKRSHGGERSYKEVKSEEPFSYEPALLHYEINKKCLRSSKRYDIVKANDPEPFSQSILAPSFFSKISASPSTSAMVPFVPNLTNPIAPSSLMIVSPPPPSPVFMNNTQVQEVQTDSIWRRESRSNDFVVKTHALKSPDQVLVSPVAYTGEKKFKCDQCKRSFTEWTQLMEHQKTHSMARHTCTECGKSFSKMSQLVLHRRTHTGEKPYVCGKCGKQFSQKFNLVVHQRIHTGEKPFKCSQCNKEFRYRTGLLKHQKYGLCL